MWYESAWWIICCKQRSDANKNERRILEMLITSGRRAAPLHYTWCIRHTCMWRHFIILNAHPMHFWVVFFYQWHNKITGKTKGKQLKYMYINREVSPSYNSIFFLSPFLYYVTITYMGLPWICIWLNIYKRLRIFSIFVVLSTFRYLDERSEDSIKPLSHYPRVTVAINCFRFAVTF